MIPVYANDGEGIPMIEIHSGLWIGSEADYYETAARQQGWAVVHACKEPFHRQALGYSGRGAPKNHPEYLFARRGDRLILNLVDVDDPAYIRKEIIDAAINFIDEGVRNGQNVLVHCNQGESRGPSIGFLYLVARTTLLPIEIGAAESRFREMYPRYNPAAGMRGFIHAQFSAYCPGPQN
jgi:hypothetical protein